MQKVIQGDLVDVVIVHKNNKNIYLRFKEDKKLYAYCSPFVSNKKISELIDNNIEKITKMYKKIDESQENDLYFSYLGKNYTIVYNENCKAPVFEQDMFIISSPQELDCFWKKECERIFIGEVARIKSYFANLPEFTVRIRKMKTRWGVCNRRNNTVTLNSELLKKDIDLLDYVIIHELCHFYEANHSQKFWSHVSRYYPNYKEARKRLRS